MALDRYLAEEVAEDHADGIITRREALRRLGLLGLGVAAATTLLAACARGEDPAVATPDSTTSPAATGGEAAATQDISFPGPGGRMLLGAWAAPADADAGVLVVHENRGLNDHIRSVAGRLAADGYAALAIDLLSEEGGTAAFDDEAAATAALGRAPAERFVEDMRAGVTEIRRRLPAVKVGVVGFCFGGGMVWELLHAGEDRLSAAVPFYGPAPQRPDFSRAKAAVLGVYAERDDRVNATRDAAREALEQAGLTHEIVTFPDADHAFFNDTGARHNPSAAAEAYQRTLAWFARHLA